MFINRNADILFLQSDFINSDGKSRLLIISGPTGIGKSELVNQAYADYENFVRVRIAKHEGVKNVPTLYVKELARSLNHLSLQSNNILSFSKHFKGKERSFKSTLKKIFGDIAENNKLLASKEFGRLIKDKHSDNDLLDIVFTSDHSEAFSTACSYIKRLIEGEKLIITLENIQNIDKESLIYFRELLILNPSLYLIGEYTSDENAQIDKFDLLNYFSGSYTKCDILELKKLPLHEIIKECSNKPEVISAILKDSYDKSSGNLHHLQILVSDSFSNMLPPEGDFQILQYDNIILKELDNLDSEQGFIVSAIVAHGGDVDFEILRIFVIKQKVVSSITLGIRSIDDIIDDLIEKKILKKVQSQVQTAQDSIIEKVLSNPVFKKYLLISYRNWLLFYQSLDKASDLYVPKSEILSWQILFKAFLDDISGMNELLEEVYKLSLLSSAPKRAIRYLEKVKDTLIRNIDINNRNLTNKIDLKIIQILYRLWYFEEIPLYTIGHLTNRSIFLFHVSALALIGRADECIDICNDFLNKNKYEESLEVLIIRLSAYRASNRYNECELEWLRLDHSKTFVSTAYEGMFLRCADFALMSDNDKLIKCLLKSINIFSEKRDTLNEISARIALAQYFGYGGELEKAKKEMDIAEAKSRLFFARHYVIENNYCVIDLQSNLSSLQIIERLQRASSVCETILDRFIILNNLFVAQSMLGLEENAELTLRVIEQKLMKSEVQDYDLQRIAIFNAYVHYLKLQNESLSEFYLSRARKLPVLADNDYWNCKLYDNSINSNDDFRLSLDYYPIYITYWHFDFDTLQDSFQLVV